LAPFCLVLALFLTDPAAVFSHAVELQRAGDLDGAIREYQAFLALRPDSPQARSNLGAALTRRGRYQEAIEQYVQALALTKDDPKVRFNLGLAYYKTERIAEAEQELARVIAAQPGNDAARLLLGECRVRLGEYPKAIAALEPLEADHRDDRAFAYLMGTALIRDEQVSRGQRYIDRIFRNGGSAEARMLTGVARLEAMDFKGAIQDLEAAIALDPDLPGVHGHHGRALLRLGDTAAAAAAFEEELRRSPNDFESHLSLGVLAKSSQRYDEALAHFQRAAQARPQDVNVRYYLGSLQVSMGWLAEAQQLLEEVTREAPQLLQAHVLLATVYYRLGRKQDGEREREIIQRLNAEEQARSPKAQSAAP
jgi:tetratricopeptide (TPR) repeat protein